ncbi:histidine phosphatase family protein [Nocardia ninae]|uniref:histidine phosphatase family protein n=1 Tax=Nocardia ninae TaxID=356145 RepID=UPI0011BF36B4
MAAASLTGQGRHQIELLAHRLGRRQFEHPIHALYTSPLPRTRESAAIIGMHLRITPEVVPQLAEQDHGSADGRHWHDVVHEYGGIPALDPDRALTPDGETWREYLHRSSQAISRILAQHTAIASSSSGTAKPSTRRFTPFRPTGNQSVHRRHSHLPRQPHSLAATAAILDDTCRWVPLDPVVAE